MAPFLMVRSFLFLAAFHSKIMNSDNTRSNHSTKIKDARNLISNYDDNATSTETSNDAAMPTKLQSAAHAQQKDINAESKVESKNQRKKRQRHERAMDVKKRRKQQDRAIKEAKAAVAGRDLDAERRALAARTLTGEGKRRRQENWKRRMQQAVRNFEVCFDCSYETSLRDKEISSLASQIRLSYGINKRIDAPCYLAAVGLSENSQTLGHLKNVSGFKEWADRDFVLSPQPLQTYYADRLDRIVYLTSDSPHTLANLEANKVYVIGGIVDRNRLKGIAYTKAQNLNVATAQLPISEYLANMPATKVLTCNHVFEILMTVRCNGGNWKEAMLKVLPQRKDAKAKVDDSGN